MHFELLLVDDPNNMHGPNAMQDCRSCGTGGELQVLGVCRPRH